MSRRHSAVSVLTAVLVGLSVWGILIWRARTTTLTAYRLCVVFAALVDQADRTLGKPGTSSYAYFKANPDARAVAHRENRRLLAQLPCQPPKEKP